MDYVKKALSLLPDELRDMYSPAVRPEELRVRKGRRVSALCADGESFISKRAADERDITAVLERVTGASMHAYIDELANGYINHYGLRIGVCGAAAIKNGEISGYRHITSLNIRIPAEFTGNIDDAAGTLLKSRGTSALVISPPGGGKTTALRELIRRMSNAGERISVVDERGELSAGYDASAGFDLGSSSDVMVGVKKSRAAIMLLRAMNPTYIAMDEITEKDDIAAIKEINGCGVALLATAHAETINDLRTRELYRQLLDEKIFDYALNITKVHGKRVVSCERLSK